MMNSYLSRASSAQKTAILHRDGPMMVLAGPGSGKTFVITARLCHMILSCRIPPEKILVISFTKAAATEMEERAGKLTDRIAGVTFGTFHAVFFRILRSALHYSANDILTEREQLDLLREAAGNVLSKDADRLSTEHLLTQFSYLKNTGKLFPEPSSVGALVSGRDMRRIFDEYRRLADRDHKLDFDDMAPKCLELFRSSSEVLEVFRERYRYILIDEFQDINPVQYEVIRLLAAPRNNLFIVGDDDQSIYSFRGAAPELMLRFPADYPHAASVTLDTNHRSTDSIVKTALRLVSKNKKRYPKKLKAEKKGTGSVTLLSCEDVHNECDTVCRLIRQASGYMELNDIAILFRTNAQTKRYSRALSRAGIPFSVRERVDSIFHSPAGLDIRAMIAFSNGDTSRENLLRFLNRPPRFIPRRILPEGNIDLSLLCQEKEPDPRIRKELRRLYADLATIRDMHPYAAINYIRKGMDYEHFLLKEATSRGADPEDLLDTLEQLSDSARNVSDVNEWFSLIEGYENDLNKASRGGAEKAVALLTMHGSKGLEYRTVLIPDVNEGCIPQKKAMDPSGIEEERRLLYVAMTRAKERLILLYLKKDPAKRKIPSRFLKELRIR